MAPCSAIPGRAVSGQMVDAQTELVTVIQDLQARLRRLEDTEAIRNLKSRYAQLCDRNYSPDQLANLFTEDAVWDGAAFGVFRGREQIRAFFAGVSRQITWALHYMAGPEITINSDGETASGCWYLFEPCTMTQRNNPGTKEPVLQMAKYEDSYRRVDGVWKFAHVKIEYEALTNLYEGWVAQPFRP